MGDRRGLALDADRRPLAGVAATPVASMSKRGMSTSSWWAFGLPSKMTCLLKRLVSNSRSALCIAGQACSQTS